MNTQNLNNLNLPTKDKNGNNFLTPSEITTFIRSKEDYYNQYISKKPFVTNEYIEFGSKVGNSLECNYFGDFEEIEKNVLKKATRLDLFERKTFLKYDGFYVVGRIDTCKDDFSNIIEYKTGGAGKDKQYKEKTFLQLPIYALSIRQELGITPKNGSVEFITRGGNLYRGEKLHVKNVDPIKIEIDISEERIKNVYWKVLKTAKNINEFYKNNK